jgi:hypothetical protein
MLANRRLSSRRGLKIPYIAYMSRGKPRDKTLAKRRRASQRLSSRSPLNIHAPRETTRHDANKATPIQDAIGSLGSHNTRRWQTKAERRNACRRDAKSRANLCEHETRETTRNDAERSHASHRDADLEHQTKPRKVPGSDTARFWQTYEQRRDANRADTIFSVD